MTRAEWIACAERLPERGVTVETKIDDGVSDVRNVQPLKLHSPDIGGRLWFVPDGNMYVYYEPTHWRPL